MDSRPEKIICSSCQSSDTRILAMTMAEQIKGKFISIYPYYCYQCGYRGQARDQQHSFRNIGFILMGAVITLGLLMYVLGFRDDRYFNLDEELAENDISERPPNQRAKFLNQADLTLNQALDLNVGQIPSRWLAPKPFEK